MTSDTPAWTIKSMEEANEVGKACAKLTQFGAFSYAPDSSEHNLMELENELMQLVVTINQLILSHGITSPLLTGLLSAIPVNEQQGILSKVQYHHSLPSVAS